LAKPDNAAALRAMADAIEAEVLHLSLRFLPGLEHGILTSTVDDLRVIADDLAKPITEQPLPKREAESILQPVPVVSRVSRVSEASREIIKTLASKDDENATPLSQPKPQPPHPARPKHKPGVRSGR